MINPGLLQKLLLSKKQSVGAVKIIRPCEPGWATIPKPILFEVMGVIADAAKRKKCKAEDLCVAVHLDEDKLHMVAIYDKVPKPVKGWRRIAAAWDVLSRGRI